MINVTEYSAEKFLKTIDALPYDQLHLYRGQPNASFTLNPKAFREEILQKYANEFPTPKSVITGAWFSGKINEFLEHYTPGFRKNIAFNHTIKKLFNLITHIMRYNFFIENFIRSNPTKFEADEESIKNLKPPLYWHQEETFIQFLQYTYPKILNFLNLKNEMIIEGKIDEILTAFDETYAQHYNIATAALDWSENPHKALFFSLENIPTDARFISLYAYKQIIFSPTSPVIIKEKSQSIFNERAIAQEGRFTYFNFPCSFYMYNGRFPAINDYINFYVKNGHLFKPPFEITKYNLEINSKNITFIKDKLFEMNITHKSIYLE